MSIDDKESFLSRWSQRKLESTRERTPSVPTAPGSATGAPAPGESSKSSAPPKRELPAVDSLKGLTSEYKDFLHPSVDEKLRHTALKKLFSDPHFNVIDLMDVYIDDYSKPDPIPEAMLRTLEHAKGLLFDEEKKEEEVKNAGAGPGPEAGRIAERDKAGPDAGSRATDEVRTDAVASPSEPKDPSRS